LLAIAGNEDERARGASQATKTRGMTSASALGGTTTGIDVRQPIQQPAQILPSVWLEAGACWSATLLWQITRSDWAAVAAAARAAPKLAARLASAIA
jgi:hypothetical protein